MPTFNSAAYIGESIESVIGQSFSSWELLIQDDGSTDATAEIVGRYRDSRIRYERQEHLGIWRLPETYNRALMRSRGRYVAILESDDIWAPGALQAQKTAL